MIEINLYAEMQVQLPTVRELVNSVICPEGLHRSLPCIASGMNALGSSFWGGSTAGMVLS